MTRCFSKYACVVTLLALAATVCERGPSNLAPEEPARPSGPAKAAIGFPSVYSTFTVDPEDDSVAYRFDWGDGRVSPWSRYLPTGSTYALSHGWDTVGGYSVKAQATDRSGAISDWSVPATVSVSEDREPKWVNDSLYPYTSMLLLNDGREDLIYFGDDEGNINAVSPKGEIKHTYSQQCGDLFSGHPCWNAATGHIIAGNESGELYAFTPALEVAWHWPGNTGEQCDGLIWGTAVVNGDRVYVVREDSGLSERVYYFRDLGTEAVLMNTFAVDGDEVCDPLVLDSKGNVIFVTSWGTVGKLTPDIDSLLWAVEPGSYEIYGQAIDDEDRVYLGCGRELVVLNPDGSLAWLTSIDGPAWRPAVGANDAFIANDEGSLFAVDRTSGEIRWSTLLEHRDGGPCDEFDAPTLTENGLLYVAAACGEMLFCVDQTDGHIVWQCCLLDFPRSCRLDLCETEGASLTILPNGDIMAPVWCDALAYVRGEPQALLADAPWPKWQRDLYNTGKAGGQ
ncbi:MAG: PQQ-binding-like beta-propeller repeat protein [candidate division WOR-3 bacterium]|nr:MAG: PQQ-binding-like beta-propeller repeat protein [candidate division WOR-3 bacterium]